MPPVVSKPQSSIAVAVFVKTPGVSPVKTRLAQAVGASMAEEFYALALDCIEEVVQTAVADSRGNLSAYWAVAEPDQLGHPRWQGLPRVSQVRGSEGAVGLGERMDTVYRTLLETHRAVLLIGADSPHLTPAWLGDAARLLDQNDFVMGRSDDGGFCLFGGTRPIDSTVWTRVRYSVAETADELCAGLATPPVFLPTTFDVDTLDELLRLEKELNGRASEFLPAQRILGEYLKRKLSQLRR